MAGSTPIYGFPYPESSDLVANYPALGQDLAEDIEGVIAAIPPGGLSMVNPTSIANSGGSASASGGAVTFTSVSSVSLNGVFTSTYDYYRLLMEVKGTVGININTRFRAAGSDVTSANYGRQLLYAAATSVSSGRATAQTYIETSTNSGVGTCFLAVDVRNPALAKPKSILAFSDAEETNPFAFLCAGYLNVTTICDGFTIYPSSSTITGIIRVYGYRNS